MIVLARTLFASLLLICQAVAQPALAQIGSQPPEIGPPIPFELPPTNTIMLENGLKVTFIPWGMTPTAQIIVSVRAGNIDDGAETWLADTTVAVMEEGSAGRTRSQTATRFADMGGSLFTRVTHIHSTFATYILSESAPEALNLLADAVRRPNFSARSLPRVRQNLTHYLSSTRASPDAQALEAFLAHLYPEGHPYHSAYPTDEQINGYSIADMRRFYRANFGAQRTHIYISGRFDQAEMERAVRDNFGDWAMGPFDDAPQAIPAPGPIVHLIDRPGSPQSTVRLIYPVSPIDGKMARALEVFDNSVGAFVSTRNRELGYSYSPATYINWTRGGGYWTYADDINTPMTAQALFDVFALLDWQRGNSWDTSGTKQWMANIFVMTTASTDGLLGQIMLRDTHDLPFDYLNSYVGDIMDVPDDSLAAMARMHIRNDRMTLVIVGDLAVIEADIRALPALEGVEFIVESDRD
jgi:zinc protease